jgi:hypothetical protein
LRFYGTPGDIAKSRSVCDRYIGGDL